MITSGYRALREGAAQFDLEGRGMLRTTGNDRARLLHAMSTNHVQQLKPGEFCYAFFLNAQGRILADAHILCLDDALLLDTEPNLRRSLYEHLDRYIIADDVTLEDDSDKYAVMAVEGPRAAEALTAMGLESLPEPNTLVRWQNRMIAAASVTGAPGYRLYLRAEEKASVKDWLAGSGTTEATADDIRTARIENARPRYGDDITDTHIPHETRLLHALHFSKGCYLGQEIVERVRSRGHPNRLLVQLHLSGDKAPPRGTKILAAGKEAGEITSAVYSHGMGRVVALGYVRAEHVGTRTALEASGVPAEITERAPS